MQKIIEAETIILKDKSGAQRIVLDAAGTPGPRIEISSESGHVIELVAFPGDEGVALILKHERQHAVLRLKKEDGVFLSFTDSTGVHSVRIESGSENKESIVSVYKNGQIVNSLK